MTTKFIVALALLAILSGCIAQQDKTGACHAESIFDCKEPYPLLYARKISPEELKQWTDKFRAQSFLFGLLNDYNTLCHRMSQGYFSGVPMHAFYSLAFLSLITGLYIGYLINDLGQRLIVMILGDE